MLYAIPVVIYFFFVNNVNIPYWIAIAAIVLTNFMIVFEMLVSLLVQANTVSYHNRSCDNPMARRVAIIIAAYLPNEVDIIHASLRAHLLVTVPRGVALDIVLSHNGGGDKHLRKLASIISDLQQELDQLQAGQHNSQIRLRQYHVINSCSKAENVNHVLERMMRDEADWPEQPEVVALFDADAHPHGENMVRAIKTLASTNADIVQGRNCVARGFKFVAIEFDIIYCIYHPGGEILRGFGLFGGSNGYWKFDMINEIRMDKSMLTEDIDSAMRAQRAGAKVVYNRDIISMEEAPPTLEDLAKQRLRWTQGWTEVALRHAFPMIFGTPLGCCCFSLNDRTSQLNWPQRFGLSLQMRIGIFFLMVWREIFHYLSAQAMPAGIVALVKCETDSCRNSIFVIMTFAFFTFPIINAFIARLVRGPIHRDNLYWYHYVIYALISPFYEWIKVHISVLGHARTIVRLTKWRVTHRHAPAS